MMKTEEEERTDFYMKNITCTNCGAPIDWNETERMLKCPYCHSQFVNEYYKEDADGEEGDFDSICLEKLIELCESGRTDLASLDMVYGNPIASGHKLNNAMENMEIDGDEEVYLIYGSDNGFALCTCGMYFYDDENDTGFLNWGDWSESEIMYDKKEGCLYIGEVVFCMDAESGKAMVGFLNSLQENANNAWEEDGGDENGGDSGDLESVCVEKLLELCEEDGERFYDCIYGDPITEGKKLPNVRKCLKVPEGDEIYYIYDSTILGSGKEGFALTSSGMYYKFGWLNEGSLFWQDILDSRIRFEKELCKENFDSDRWNDKNNGKLCIGTVSFNVRGDLGKYLEDFFYRLQRRVEREW